MVCSTDLKLYGMNILDLAPLHPIVFFVVLLSMTRPPPPPPPGVADRAVQRGERTGSDGAAEAGDRPLGGHAEASGGKSPVQLKRPTSL